MLLLPETGLGEEGAQWGSERRWVVPVAMTSTERKSGMETGDLSGLEAGVLGHLASKLKGLEGVGESSK